jgi:hypothetical protein
LKRSPFDGFAKLRAEKGCNHGLRKFGKSGSWFAIFMPDEPFDFAQGKYTRHKNPAMIVFFFTAFMSF